MEFVPIALACGHSIEGPADFKLDAQTAAFLEAVGLGDACAAGPATRWDLVGEDAKPYSTMLCPEGCGWQQWVAESAAVR